MAKNNKDNIPKKNKNENSLKYMFYIILIFLFFLFFLNFIYINFIMINKVTYINEIQFLENNYSFNILILGDSHAADGINPKFINNSFNFAVSGESYNLNYYKLRKILNNKNNNISVIILPFDIHSFSGYRTNQFSNVNYWSKYLSFNELLNLTGRNLISLHLQNIFPVIGNGEDFINFILTSKKTNITNGWTFKNPDFNKLSEYEKIKSSRNRLKTQIPSDNLINKSQLIYFNKILNLTNNYNITLVLIKFPVSKYYLNATIDRKINISNFYNELNKTLDLYNNIYIFNYQNLFINNDSYFYNTDHLDYIGANILSKKIYYNLIKENIINNN